MLFVYIKKLSPGFPGTSFVKLSIGFVLFYSVVCISYFNAGLQTFLRFVGMVNIVFT